MEAAICRQFYRQSMLNSDIHLCPVIQGGKSTSELQYYHFDNATHIKTFPVFYHLSFWILHIWTCSCLRP